MENPYAPKLQESTPDDKLNKIMKILLIENQEKVAESRAEIKMHEENIKNAEHVIKQLKTDMKHLNIMY